MPGLDSRCYSADNRERACACNPVADLPLRASRTPTQLSVTRQVDHSHLSAIGQQVCAGTQALMRWNDQSNLRTTHPRAAWLQVNVQCCKWLVLAILQASSAAPLGSSSHSILRPFHLLSKSKNSVVQFVRMAHSLFSPHGVIELAVLCCPGIPSKSHNDLQLSHMLITTVIQESYKLYTT